MTPQYCAVCQSITPIRFRFKRWGHRILQCTKCQLVFTDPDISATEIERIYQADYFTGGQSDGYADYDKSESVLKIEFQSTLDYLKNYVPNGKTLLEIGCAYGYFLEVAASQFRCKGIDISEHATAICKEKGLDVSTATNLNGPELTDQKFDIAIMLDCIEHLPHPDAMVKEIHGHLNPDGYLLISTGDIGSPFARLMGRYWRLMTPPQHLFFFSSKTLTQVLESSGYRVVDIQHPAKVVPLSLVLYQLKHRYKLNLLFLNRIFTNFGIRIGLGDAMRVLAQKN